MDVSIIIPAYNVDKYIQECIETVLHQKTKYTYEVICVDDGSTDKTQEILRKYQNKIKLVCTENKGPGAARNIALKEAIGQYVMFVDGDDYVSENFVEKMMESIEQENAEIAICNFCRVCSNGKIEKVDKGEYKVYYKNNINEVLLMEFHSCNKIFKKSLIEKNKYPEDIFFEDVVAISKAIIDATKIVKIQDFLYFYRRTKDSITNNLTDKNYDIIKALGLISDKFIDNGYDRELEFLNINNLLVDLAIKVLKSDGDMKKYKEITNSVIEKYPNWYKNQYIQTTKITKRIYLYCLKNNLYKIIKFYFNR